MHLSHACVRAVCVCVCVYACLSVSVREVFTKKQRAAYVYRIGNADEHYDSCIGNRTYHSDRLASVASSRVRDEAG